MQWKNVGASFDASPTSEKRKHHELVVITPHQSPASNAGMSPDLQIVTQGKSDFVDPEIDHWMVWKTHGSPHRGSPGPWGSLEKSQFSSRFLQHSFVRTNRDCLDMFGLQKLGTLRNILTLEKSSETGMTIEHVWNMCQKLISTTN